MRSLAHRAQPGTRTNAVSPATEAHTISTRPMAHCGQPATRPAPRANGAITTSANRPAFATSTTTAARTIATRPAPTANVPGANIAPRASTRRTTAHRAQPARRARTTTAPRTITTQPPPSPSQFAQPQRRPL
jgi:hypothetical protein